jgi:DNA-binding transcriptional ArsR family regulator
VATYSDPIAAAADPTRRAILEQLRSGPRSVGELAEGLPVSRPAVSQHLRVLKDARLVSEQRAGTRRIYRLDPAGVGDLRAWADSFWDDALAAYKRAVEGEEEGP